MPRIQMRGGEPREDICVEREVFAGQIVAAEISTGYRTGRVRIDLTQLHEVIAALTEIADDAVQNEVDLRNWMAAQKKGGRTR